MSGDPLFKGLTRPATLMGVTYSGLIINMMITMVSFLALDSLAYFLLFIPIHALMYLVCRWDERFFDLLLIYFKTKGADPKRYYHKAPSHRQ